MENIHSPYYKPRQEKYFKQIKTYIKTLENQMKNLPEELTDEEFDNQLKQLSDQSLNATTALYDSQVKQIRKPNEWIETFLKSFKHCESKKITTRQANIFYKLGEQWEAGRNSIEYRFIYQDNVYIISVFTDCGYLTIRPIIKI